MSPTSQVRVLLVDDEPSTHFLHKRVIRKAVPSASTISVLDGRAAMDFMLAARDFHEPCPTHIWLDLQMPQLDGWSFLKEYLALPASSHCNPAITIVTSSPNPSDQSRALGVPRVVAYVEKFVTAEECLRILSLMPEDIELDSNDN